MTPSADHAMRTRLSPRARRVSARITLLIGAAAVAALAVLTTRLDPHSSAPAPAPTSSSSLQSVRLPVERNDRVVLRMTGVQSSVVRNDHLMLRVTADTIALGRPHAFGPFRLGFLRAVSAHHLTVESWETEAVTALMPDALSGAAAVLPAGRNRIAYASADRVRFILHRTGSDVTQLDAHACETTRQRTLRCRYGALREGDQSTRFREAVYDGGGWTLDGREAKPPS